MSLTRVHHIQVATLLMFAYERIRNVIRGLEQGTGPSPDQLLVEIENERDLTSAEKQELSSLLAR